MLTDRQRKILDLRDDKGMTFRAIAAALGCRPQVAHAGYKAARAKIDGKAARLDPGVREVLGGLGMGDLAGQHSGWVHRENKETGEWASTYYFLGKDDTPDQASLETVMSAALEKTFTPEALAIPARPAPTGDNLLVIDVADLHIGKLCVRSEVGVSYDRREAVRRGIEGTRTLLARAQAHGVAHILFVVGNDVIHVDDPRGRTTAGTPQDTDGTQAVMWDDAFAFYAASVDLCRAVAPVSLLYCPSNHDWFSGFTLARALGHYYAACPEVSATDYNTSHRHRKYFRFGANLLGFTHGDGAKESDLVALMLEEAPEHLAAARRRYWYLHHLHHKIAKRGAGSRIRQTEKDLVGSMTVLRDVAGVDPGDAPEIEYVRSASPADGWHDRNGYVNRQGVEVFLHHAHAGQVARFTEWF